jgi:hypothetical protein
MPPIGKLSIISGPYFIYPRVSWIIYPGGQQTTQTGQWPMLVTNESFTYDPGEAGCPNGANVWPYLGVVGGDNVQGSASDNLIYTPGDIHAAYYHCSGTSVAAQVEFDGILPPE